MQSKATSVEAYLAELPADRREALSRVRDVILRNLDKDYEEGMAYGMIGYAVPHRVYPAGYHCDPRQPLPFAGLASQKNHMSLHLMCVYLHAENARWFTDAWAKTGKKLDMGKACIRFKKVDDLALDVIGEAVRRVPAAKYIAIYEQVLQGRSAGKSKPAAGKTGAAKARADTSGAGKARVGKSGAAKAGKSTRSTRKPARSAGKAAGKPAKAR